jgi:hypothetical protein
MDQAGGPSELREAPWSVEGLIAAAERIMSAAPELFAYADGDDKRELNVRLIRDYVVRGFIPRPVRLSREARFGRDHLVHLLAVRALLRNQKWSLPAIKASFITTDTQGLLDGVLGRVRSRIEAECRRATKAEEDYAPRAEEGVRTPSLNPAQLLIEQFKAPKRSSSNRADIQLPASAAIPAFVDSSWAGKSARQKDESRRRLHVPLNPWCEVVLDTDHFATLTSEEIEFLGETLKRRLRSQKAH